MSTNRPVASLRCLIYSLPLAAALLVLILVPACGMFGGEAIEQARTSVDAAQVQAEALPPSPERDDALKALETAEKALVLAESLESGQPGPEFWNLIPQPYATYGALALALLGAFRARHNRVAGREVAQNISTDRATKLKVEAARPGFKMPL